MSAIFMDGFDHYGTGAASATNMIGVANTGIGAYTTVQNVVGAVTQCGAPSWGPAATGPCCLVSMSAPPATKQNAAIWTMAGSATSPGIAVFVGLRFAMDAVPFSSATTTVLRFIGAASATMAYLGVSTTGALVLYSAAGGVLGQTADGLITPQTFHYLEMCWDPAKTTFTLRVDDTFASLTPALTVNNAVVATVYALGLIPCVDSVSGDVGHFQQQYIDDFYVRDSVNSSLGGAINTSWLGAMYIAWVPVNGDSTPMQWVPTGATGGAYTTLNKSTPDDTTYISAPVTPAIANFTATGIPHECAQVSAIQVVARAWRGSSATLILGMQNSLGVTSAGGNALTAAPTVYNGIVETNDTNVGLTPRDLVQNTIFIEGNPALTGKISQLGMLVAYPAQPTNSAPAWIFDLDGHRFYVLPLGLEGDWALDLTTSQWCQLQTRGFSGLNFTRGVMWGLRIVGADIVSGDMYELDPNQALDEGWRPVEHIVTGGLSTRGRNSIGCASFTLTASPADIQQAGETISLSFSDDQGQTWVGPFTQALTGAANQLLTWSALGSFSAPGRIFQITDTAGVVRIDGADAALQNYNEDGPGQ